MSAKKDHFVLIASLLILLVLVVYCVVTLIHLFVSLSAPWYFILAICTILGILGFRAIRDFKRGLIRQEVTVTFRNREVFLEKLTDRMDDLGLVLTQQSDNCYHFGVDVQMEPWFKYTRFIVPTAATVDITIQEQTAQFRGSRAILEVLQRQILSQRSFERV